MTRWLAPAIFVLWFGFAAVSVAATTPPDALNGPQLARYQALIVQLRCLICQNRSIADSDAPLADDLRHIVARQVVAGRSDAQIKQYLVDRYGEWVLYNPPFEYGTLLLWLGPFALLLIGLGVALLIMRRRSAGPDAAPALDRARLARLLDDSAPNKDRS